MERTLEHLMMTGHGRHWRLLLATLVAASLFAWVGQQTYAQEPIVSVEMASTTVDAGGDVFTASIVVQNVTNLGAFQFDLAYDAAVLAAEGVEEGDFLGSSGREVRCLPPREQAGSVGLSCVTLGAAPDGPTGSGVLATVTFRPVAAGASTLHFARVTLTDPPANQLPSQAQDVTVTVEGDNGGSSSGFRWVLWGPVIGGAAAALVAAGGFAWWTRRRQQA